MIQDDINTFLSINFILILEKVVLMLLGDFIIFKCFFDSSLTIFINLILIYSPNCLIHVLIIALQ